MTDFTFLKHLLEILRLAALSWNINVYQECGKNNAHALLSELYKPTGKALFLLELK